MNKKEKNKNSSFISLKEKLFEYKKKLCFIRIQKSLNKSYNLKHFYAIKKEIARINQLLAKS